MIADASERLITWLHDALAPVPVDLEPPGGPEAAERVSCYLWSVAPVDLMSGTRRAPLRFALLFVLSVDAASALRGAELLDRVIASAGEHPELELTDEAPGHEFWRAFGARPRPALVVRSHARLDRQDPVAAPVLSPLAVQAGAVHRLRGRVLSPQGVPVASAEVRLQGDTASTWTDNRGRFAIAAAPAGADRRFIVQARGRSYDIAAGESDDAQLELVIDPIGAPQ